jgi:hypothetical protein
VNEWIDLAKEAPELRVRCCRSSLANQVVMIVNDVNGGSEQADMRFLQKSIALDLQSLRHHEVVAI